jgi:hypothetical protein
MLTSSNAEAVPLRRGARALTRTSPAGMDVATVSWIVSNLGSAATSASDLRRARASRRTASVPRLNRCARFVHRNLRRRVVASRLGTRADKCLLWMRGMRNQDLPHQGQTTWLRNGAHVYGRVLCACARALSGSKSSTDQPRSDGQLSTLLAVLGKRRLRASVVGGLRSPCGPSRAFDSLALLSTDPCGTRSDRPVPAAVRP